MSLALIIAQNLASTVAGLLVGFLIGRATRDVHRIANAVTEKDTPMSRHAPRRPHWLSFELIVAVIVVALGVLTVAQGLVQSAATERLTECQAAYSNQLADVIEARSVASAEAQAALDELMSVAANATDRQVVRQALADYLHKRETVKQEQRAHPYPEPPRDACR